MEIVLHPATDDRPEALRLASAPQDVDTPNHRHTSQARALNTVVAGTRPRRPPTVANTGVTIRVKTTDALRPALRDARIAIETAGTTGTAVTMTSVDPGTGHVTDLATNPEIDLAPGTGTINTSEGYYSIYLSNRFLRVRFF